MGIGTTNPAYLLDVDHPTANSNVARIKPKVGSGDIEVLTLQSGNGDPILTARNTGNVGIGTTSPGAKLDVEGTIRSGSAAVGNKGNVIHEPCTTVSVYSSNAGWSTAVAPCPGTTRLTGGGGGCNGYPAALHISYPNGNSWQAACGYSTEPWGPAPTTAYAICCRND